MASSIRLDRTLGPLVVSWIETNLVHGPGDVQGQAIELDDEQVKFVLGCYAIDDDGRRLVRRAVFSRPKGRAKSELAAMLVCAESLGPVRFRGWGHDGRPLGGPVQSPYVPCVATEEGQAGNVFQAVAFMLGEGAVSATEGLDVGMTRVFLPDGGKILPITARATSKEGGRETFAVFDETHLFKTPELVRLHETIRRNLAKRRAAEPWSLEVSTMYAPGEESVAEFSHRYAETATGLAARGFLFDHREAPTDFDFDDDELLREALAVAYGAAAEWVDLDRMVAEARDPQTRESDFRRYVLICRRRPRICGSRRLCGLSARTPSSMSRTGSVSCWASTVPTTATRRRLSVAPSTTRRGCSWPASGRSRRAFANGWCRERKRRLASTRR